MSRRSGSTCTWTFGQGGRFTCPECGKGGCAAHDTTEKTWRHLDFFQHEAFLHARVPRVSCDGCGVKLVEVPWARTGSGFTLLFEALILALVKSMPVAAVARLDLGLLEKLQLPSRQPATIGRHIFIGSRQSSRARSTVQSDARR